ncbi:chemotaxis protein CheW [Neiella sp. HB171785]|uniref:Chemotaxis protein CheW n=1 Tax=Neiella litorisoli TaxID=2771431 RepID=A0A8J6UJ37_9GAMM|nr:chemotaxis protein CheW [Neiella litorisoli]MBD1389838.1 chemotaxis protein CheW [Neiella litorisoli]
MKSSDKALQEFFTALLEEKQSVEPQIDSAPLQKLLDDVGVAPTKPAETPEPAVITAVPEVVVTPEPVVVETTEQVVASEVSTEQAAELSPDNVLSQMPPEPTGEFQALYFEVAGMTLAVPLEQLGGIHNLDEEQVSSLFGKPDWFKGLMPHRERKLNVVDTALWVMPEKYDEKLAEQLNYQYLVMLKDSNWGLACEKLITTSQLMPAEVNWRATMGKRPWLRGMVKEHMCALLNVDALVELLETGLNSQQANNPE